MNCLESKISWDKSFFFNLHERSLGRHVNTASRKSLEIQAHSINKTKNLFEAKICMKIMF